MKQGERDEMLGKLRGGICIVEFTKRDGPVRRMRCTLQPKILKLAFEKDELEDLAESTREPNQSVLVVYDLECNEWRSFRIDSVRSFEQLQ